MPLRNNYVSGNFEVLPVCAVYCRCRGLRDTHGRPLRPCLPASFRWPTSPAMPTRAMLMTTTSLMVQTAHDHCDPADWPIVWLLFCILSGWCLFTPPDLVSLVRFVLLCYSVYILRSRIFCFMKCHCVYIYL